MYVQQAATAAMLQEAVQSKTENILLVVILNSG